jgi:endonuclease/exonuclease/phosphatase family metal-dependent hydrolase
VRIAIATCALAAGCFGVTDEGGAWEPIVDGDGDLPAEIGVPVSSAPPRDTSTLRIVTWNLHRAPEPEAFAKTIAQSPALSRADVLLVQEIETHPGEPTTRARRLAEALGMSWIYVPARVEGDGTQGLAILSRFPLAEPRALRLPHAKAAWRTRNRIAIAADLELGDRRVPIVNIHLDVRISAADRVRQLSPAITGLPAAVIIGGDFNTNPWAWVASTVPLTGTEAIVGQDQATVIDDYLAQQGFAIAIPPDAVTFNLPLIGGRLDNVYPREHALVAAGIATDAGGSDHWPVWTDIALAP